MCNYTRHYTNHDVVVDATQFFEKKKTLFPALYIFWGVEAPTSVRIQVLYVHENIHDFYSVVTSEWGSFMLTLYIDVKYRIDDETEKSTHFLCFGSISLKIISSKFYTKNSSLVNRDNTDEENDNLKEIRYLYLEWITWCWCCYISGCSSANNRTASNWTATSAGSSVYRNWQHIDLCNVLLTSLFTVVRMWFQIDMDTIGSMYRFQASKAVWNPR